MERLFSNVAAKNSLVFVAGAIGYVLLNRIGIRWIQDSSFETAAFRDGCTLFLTQLLPAAASGLMVGLLAKRNGALLGISLFTVLAAIGIFFRFWRIPFVSAQSAHNRLLHYFLYSPIVAWAFGSAGAWFGERFSTGDFTIADREPLVQQGDD